MPDDPKQQKLRLKDRRQRLMWVKVAAGAAVTAFVLLAVFYVARLPGITIAKVEVSGTAALDQKNVEETAASALAGSYFFLIPKNNALVYSHDAVSAAVLNAFPEVAEVSVERDGWNALKVAVSERAAASLWCAGTPAAPEACYLMDKNGYVYAEAPSEGTFVRFFGTLSNEPVGQTYDEGDFASLKHFVEEVSSTAKRTPDAVLLEENGDVSVRFVQGGTLQFTVRADRAALLDNIASVFAARSIDGETLETADFRFGDKVYVKFREP